MTNDPQDRPAVLRRAPRPSPDEKVDPVDYPAPTTVRKIPRREITVSLSTRISQGVSDILYAAVEAEGISVRDAVEQGIKARWGNK
jgi:hypothetical protein